MLEFDNPLLCVYALRAAVPPLLVLQETLDSEEYPAQIGVQIAGAATEEELTTPDWEAAFIRWTHPEMHEICLIERDVPGQDPEADSAIAAGLRIVANSGDEAGRLIVADHLQRTQAVYQCQILPALLTDDDHPAWAALDVVLRALALETDGMIYAAAEGFCDADGELMLAEDEATPL